MNPNLQTPQPEQTPNENSIGGMQPQMPATSEAQPLAVTPQPEVQPVMPVEPAFQQPMPISQPVQPVQPVAPVQPMQPVAQPMQPTYSSYDPTPASHSSGFMAMLNEKAGLLSLAVFMVMFLILSIATVIDINSMLSDLKEQYAAYGYSASVVPSLFEVVKESIKHWVFVNPISAWWWILSLVPALGLAGFGLFKSKLKSIPAMVTVVLVVEVYLNLIIK